MRNNVRRKIIFSVITAALMLAAGCRKESSVKEPTEEPTPTVTEIPVSYMEECMELLVIKPKGSVYAEQPGAEYPKFEKYTYYSKTAERDTNVNVLLPPGYTEEKEYPVLYILHGFWDNEEWMARTTVALNIMLSNLIANGEAEEMIIVLPYIYCSKDMPYCTGMDLTNSLNYDNFINDMVTDVMPFIENTFSVKRAERTRQLPAFPWVEGSLYLSDSLIRSYLGTSVRCVLHRVYFRLPIHRCIRVR